LHEFGLPVTQGSLGADCISFRIATAFRLGLKILRLGCLLFDVFLHLLRRFQSIRRDQFVRALELVGHLFDLVR
jgi:hypothetical protein